MASSCPADAAPEQLAETLDRVLGDPGAPESDGSPRCRETALRYTGRRTVALVERELEAIVAQGARSRID